MYKLFAPLVAVASLGLATASNAAITISVDSGNLDAFSYTVNETTRTIDIYETWGTGTGPTVDLLIEGWPYGLGSWTVNKYVTNNTGVTWHSFSNELLQSDKSWSPNTDGLSFAQLGIPERPRSSDLFAQVFADELPYRDYLNFFDGSVANGQEVFLTFGLTNRRDTDATNPFYLRQTAPVPEPAIWALLISGFGLVGISLRRRRETPGRVNA